MINYPTIIDVEQNLDGSPNLVTLHDSLRLRLADDYLPGNTIIYVEGDPDVFIRFPSVGYLTLTEQCSDVELRAIAFSYTSKTIISVSYTHLTLPTNREV